MSFINRLHYYFWYFQRPPWDSGMSPPELVDCLALIPTGRAIDLGCGTGTNAITLASLGWEVTGVDFVEKAIEQAKQKAKKSGVQANFFIGDVTDLKGISGPFEFALDVGCYHSLSKTERVLYITQLDQLLTDGGIWFLYAFLRSSDDQSGIGLTPIEIDTLQSHFNIQDRNMGFDRGKRSGYFIFIKKNR